jgi:hypothetical protein
MPPAIPLIIAIAVKAVVANAFLAAIISAVLSFAITSLTAKKPKTSSNDFGFRGSASGRVQTVRQPISEHRIISGEARVGGSLTFLESGGSDNNLLHMIITMGSAGPYEEIGTIYINETPVTSDQIDGDGEVISGKYSGKLRLKKHLGAHDQVADADLVSETSVGSSFKGGGICYVYARLTYDTDIYNGVPSVSAVIKGRKPYDGRGSPTQDPDDPSTWEYSTNAMVNTLDYLRGVPSKIGDGTVVRRFGLNTVDASIDLVAFAAAADVCDEAVALAGSPSETEPRYTSNGVFETSRKPYEILNDLRTAFAGDLIYTGGVWTPVVGEYTAPTRAAITVDDLRSAPTFRPKVSRRDLYNAVKGVFVSPNHSWMPTDYPPVTSTVYEAEDNGRRIWADVDTPFTTSAATAQRLAKLNLEGHRRQVSATLPCKLTAFDIRAGDIIPLTFARFGYVNKPFYVSSWTLAAGGANGDDLSYGIDLGVKEIDANVFTWNAEDASLSVQPTSTLPDPFTVAPPTNLTVASGDAELFVRLDGTIFSRMQVSWTAPADKFVTSGGRVEVQYKKSADSVWEKWGTVEGSETFIHILDVEDGVAYDIAARSINGLGVRSDTSENRAFWSAYLASQTVQGKDAVPPDADTFNVARQSDGTRRFTFSLSPVPADVKSGGGYQIRAALGSGLAWEALSDIHTGLLSASPYETNELAAGTYTFGIKVVDSSGNESTNAVTIDAVLGDPRLRAVVASRYEYDLGWDGVIVSGHVNHAGYLEGVAASGSPSTDWGSLPNTWAELEDTWLGVVPSESTMVYTTGEIDLGTDLTFNPLVTAEVTGALTLEMQVGSSADGSSEGSPDSDNPWTAVDSVSGVRYIRARMTIVGVTPFATQMYMLVDGEVQLETYEDVDTSSSTIPEFESLGVGHFRLRTRGSTAAISVATITAFQNSGSGWTADLVFKNTTLTGSPNDDYPAVEYKIYKDGVLTDAIIDVELKGTKT